MDRVKSIEAPAAPAQGTSSMLMPRLGGGKSFAFFASSAARSPGAADSCAANDG